MFPIYVLALVFLLIAVRRIGGVVLQIWQIMLLGAFLVLAAGSITPKEALSAINFDVIFFVWHVCCGCGDGSLRLSLPSVV